MLSYESAVAYINSFINTERSADFSRQARLYNLERISRLLDLLRNPHQKLKVVHVAGSKGKGSTAALTASMLTQAGYKTGLFSKPHLITPRERCRIDSRLISETEFARCVAHIQSAIEAVAAMKALGPVSFFEIYVALAFYYFAAEAVDFAVIEVGLGGRLDATNVIDPLVSAITPISLEHTAILGDTHAAIAREKAEIIKQNRAVVLAPQVPEALAVFETVAASRNAPITLVGRDVHFERTHWDIHGQTFDIKTGGERCQNLFLPLLGAHQVVNAATAIACIEQVRQLGHAVPTPSIYNGLKTIKWPGRMQVVQASPLLVLDGAHSPASVEALCQGIREIFRYHRLIFVVGLMRDKAVSDIGRIISSIADAVIITQSSDNPRAFSPEAVREAWAAFGLETHTCPTVACAIQQARTIAAPSDLICVTGSIILIGEAMQFLNVPVEEIQPI